MIKDNQPLVSFVTPCFNSGQFIESCIKSVLAQDYPYVEHIIQDGASTDGTLDVLKKYSGKIDWVSEPDKGQSDGLNKALKRCRGDIILVLNADDELLPHAASWGVEQMQKQPEAAVVYGDQYVIDSQGKIINECRYDQVSYDFYKVLCVELVPPAQAAFIRRSHFEQVGLGADAELDTCPDYEMWVRIGSKFPMVYVPGFITRYRWYQRAFDSKQLRTVERFIESKQEVMNRVFDNPDTPVEIKKLRKRAYASLDVWAASTEISEGSKFQSLTYLLRALKIDPSFKRFRDAANVILGHLIFYRLCKLYFRTIIRIKKMLGIKVGKEIEKLYE
jgi:glycosyltransferase involved in cell wall biosynthesis